MVLIPSNYEGLPLVLLESIFLNKPFLISNLDILKEYDFPLMLLIDQRNPRDIAAKILSLIDEFHEVDFLGMRKKILGRHSEEGFQKDILLTFDRLLGEFQDL